MNDADRERPAEDSSAMAVVCDIGPGLRRVRAPNPSPMTGPGTNSYIVGHGPCAVVDPGIDDVGHIERLIAAAPGPIERILLTHRHPDHAGGALALAQRTGAGIAAWPKTWPGEHDLALAVDEELSDGQALVVGGLSLGVYHAPGHAADHVVFELADQGLLLAGDTLMQDVTVVILPPDGNMTAYLATLDRLEARAPRRIAPGHGAVLDNPQAEIAQVRAHRLQREAQIYRALESGGALSPQALVERLYPGLDTRLVAMAAAQIEAHLIRLAEQGMARCGADGWQARAGR